MRKSDGKAWQYLLFLMLGIMFGLLAGGEIMRHIISPKNAAGITLRDREQGADLQTTRTGFNDDAGAVRRSGIVEATRNVAPCVVGIVVTQIQVVKAPLSGDNFFNFFMSPELQPRYRQIESIGSGFVIRNDGMILTNFHVVQNAVKLFVNFPDGRRLEGKVIGIDSNTDIAVVGVDGRGFTAVKFGNSDEAMLGEWAIAIGNPFLNFINDVHPTVTVGVVSALNRNFAPSEGIYYQGMIQTDAAINPGNSGGPLINAAGEVIGINSFLFNPGGNNNKTSIGIGFAIPINRARRVAEELINFGHRRAIWTGISVQNLNRSVALALGYEGVEGVVVVSVQPKSPGEDAGIKTGDVITRMGNRIVQSAADIDGFFYDYFVGDKVKISVTRRGASLELELALKEFPGSKVVYRQ